MSDEMRTAFHHWFYGQPVDSWREATWLGVPILQNPLDLWILQELIVHLRPTCLIETGTHRGGSALYLATICAAVVPQAWIISVDCAAQAPADHPSIVYVAGNSVDPGIVGRVRELVDSAPPGPCLVTLDSDHRAAHVLAELRAYSSFVTPGSYLVVQDTNLNGHPVCPDWGPGPAEGLAQWLAEDAPPFDVDPSCERFGVTFFPGGWLRRRDD